MAEVSGQHYLEDRLTSLGRNELVGAHCVLADLGRLAENATSLSECYNIHKAAAELGAVNKDLDVDPYGIARAGSLDKLTESDVFLGNKYGVWTANIPEFELVKDNRPDAYMVALNQYKTYLSANFKEMDRKVLVAQQEEVSESNRTALQMFFGRHKYPKRGGNFVDMAATDENKMALSGFYSAAVGGDTKRLNMMLNNEEVRHNPIGMLIESLSARGEKGRLFSPEIEAFDGWNPAFKLGDDLSGYERYRVEGLLVEDAGDGEMPGLHLACYGQDNRYLDVTVSADKSKIIATLNGVPVSPGQMASIKEQLARTVSNAYVNMDWQFEKADKKAAEIAEEKRQAEEQERQKKTEAAKDELFQKYTAKDFRELFAAAEKLPGETVAREQHTEYGSYPSYGELSYMHTKTRHGSFEYNEIVPGFEISSPGVLFKETRSNGVGQEEPIRLCFERSNSYGVFPDGPEMSFKNGLPDEFRTNTLRWNGDEYFSSNSIYFRPDGSIDGQKTRENENGGDYKISYTSLLEKFKQIEQARKDAQIKILMKTETGYIGKDGVGLLLLDKDQNETLPGMRFRALSKPVDGICVAKVDNQYALVDLQRNDFVDRTLRPYVGEMTKDGWALIKDQKDGMAPKYNYMNPCGNKMSREGFDYATEFKEGKASVMIGQNFGEIDTNGIVTKVEIKKTMEISETTKIRIH